MAEEQGAKKVDPAEQLRGMRDNYMDVWAKAMGELVNTEAYAQQSGAVLDAYLGASQPFRESLEKAMLNALQHLSMPTRPDFISLAERLSNLEMRIDDMDTKLDRIEQSIAKLAFSRVVNEAPAPTIQVSEVPLTEVEGEEMAAEPKALPETMRERVPHTKTVKHAPAKKKNKRKGAR